MPMLDSAVNRDHAGLLGPRHQPGRGLTPPAVGTLDLVAVADFLAKQTELVIDAVGVAGHIESGERVEKAGREPAEAAVAQRRVGFFVEKDLQVDSIFGQEIAADVDDSEIEKVVLQRAADQELERQIIQPLAVGAFKAGPGREHLFDQHVAHGERGGHIPIVLGQLAPPLGQRETDVMFDKPGEQLAIGFSQRRPRHLYVGHY